MKIVAQSEALFGSACRPDSDHLSDRDVLIVDDSDELLKKRRIDLESEGYSVAAYSWKKLDALIKRRALFIQHLKLEAKILTDANGRLQKALTGFYPKNSYSAEIQENLRLAACVANYPDTLRGALWAADMLYVCARNHGILKLAEHSIYVFSANEVSERLCEAGLLDRRNEEILSQLRQLKSLYRRGAINSDLPVETLLRKASTAFWNNAFGEPLATSPAAILRNATSLPYTSAYHRLRNLEKLLLSAEAIKPDAITLEIFMKLRRWIENPRQYSNYAAKNEISLLDGFESLLKPLAYSSLDSARTNLVGVKNISEMIHIRS